MEKTDTPIKKRLSIALLIDVTTAYYQMDIILGAVEAARANDVNLFCIEGGQLGSSSEPEIRKNVLYDILSGHDVDGIVLLSSICNFTNQKIVDEFCGRFRPLPIVSILRKIEGCGCVMLDTGAGMRDLLRHLVELHQYRRFALISGPEGDQNIGIRLDIIRETLAEYDISLDDRLIATGNYLQSSGGLAVRELLAKNLPFDVLLSLNDGMAWGALEELNARGIQVPRDLAVVGFDNFIVSAYSNPPLTTVGYSLNDEGAQAVNLLIDMIRHHQPPRECILPTRLILRESCGCFSNSSAFQESVVDNPSPEMDDFYSPRKPMLLDTVLQIIHKHFPNDSFHSMPQLFHKFLDALTPPFMTEKKDDFIRSCHELLLPQLRKTDDIPLWQTILSEIRQCLIPCVNDYRSLVYMEDILHRVQLMLGEKAVEKEKLSYHLSLGHSAILNTISEDLLSAVDTGHMMDILSQKLPQLGISCGFIATLKRSPEDGIDNRRLLLAFNQEGRIPINKTGIYSEGLIPEQLLADEKPHALLISLLHFMENRFQIMGLEINSLDAGVYDALRRLVSSSMKGVSLAKIIREQEKSIVAQQEHLRNLAAIRKAMEGFILTLLQTIELKDPYTAAHQNRVAELAQALALEMNLPIETVECVRMAGVMHDLGKIALPSEVLVKPIRLNAMEMRLIREHSQTAYDILKNIEFPWPIALPILQHHERLDGSGYPAGLKGEEIGLEARILAAADVIEAMASHRPYRPALGIDDALDEIVSNRGILYDSDVADACVRLFRQNGFSLS